MKHLMVNNLRIALLSLWGAVLVGALTWPLFAPGELAWRDMLVLDSPALSPSAFGFGDLAARNVPQDGLLALFGTISPASWLARVLIIVSSAAAALAGAMLAAQARPPRSARTVPLAAQLAAMTIAVANPFVIERLLQGHWSLVIAAWLLPFIVALRDRPRLALGAVILASLTPTGAIFAIVTALVVVRARLATVVIGALVTMAWIIPSLTSLPTASTASYYAFTPRAEAYVGTLGSLLSLGGIWNAEATPASRSVGFALFGLLLFAILCLGWRAIPRRVLALALIGLGGATVAWLAPDLLAAVDPGLLRDSQKLVMLAIPAYCCAAGGLSRWWAVAALVCALAQTPDAPREVEVLAPRDITVALDEELLEKADGRDVFIPAAEPIVRSGDWVSVNPYSKAVSLVESGTLSVDGTVVDKVSPRYHKAQAAWEAGDYATLEDLGIGVVYDGGTITETGAARPSTPWGLHLLWLAAWGVLALPRRILRV